MNIKYGENMENDSIMLSRGGDCIFIVYYVLKDSYWIMRGRIGVDQ